MSNIREDVVAYQKHTSAKPAWLRERLEWFQDQKFGIILHWAPYSLWDCCESWPLSPGDPWARSENCTCWTSRDKDLDRFQRDYWDLNKQFNPTRYNPTEWARIFREAGARYVAFTTKHHDGFCMWDTKTTDYKITGADCPFHTDPRADLFKGFCDALHAEGLSISAYFSKADWHCPYYWSPDAPVVTRQANTLGDPEVWRKFVEYTHEQIRELMTGYGKIDVLWLDAGWVANEEDIDMAGLAAMARSLQPGLIVANRAVGDAYEDFVTPEQEIPAETLEIPWESCLVIAENWKFHPRDKYKSADQVLDMLVDTLSKGGNLLLGVGPTPEGEIPAQAVERLEIIGKWIAVNSEAVYGSRAVAPYREAGYRFTRREGWTYAFAQPGDLLPLTSFRPMGDVSLLGYDKPVAWQVEGDGVTFTVPPEAANLPQPIVLRFQTSPA